MTTARAALVLAVTVLTAGCAEKFDATKLGVPVTMATTAGEPVAGEPFRVTSRSVHLFWGILPAGRSSLQRALAHQAIDAPAIANVRITVRSRWSDLLISALTLGVIIPRAVTYEGIAVERR